MFVETAGYFHRIHSLAKHYSAPEVVELVVECNTVEEFFSIKDDIGLTRASLFSIGLIALEMSTLVEEDSWYTDDMTLKKDILQVKFSMLRDSYSWRLTRLVELLLSPSTVRPDVEGMAKFTVEEREESKHF